MDLLKENTVLLFKKETMQFITALFTMAERQKRLKYPSRDEMNKQNARHTYHGIAFSLKKKGKSDICDHMDDL